MKHQKFFDAPQGSTAGLRRLFKQMRQVGMLRNRGDSTMQVSKRDVGCVRQDTMEYGEQEVYSDSLYTPRADGRGRLRGHPRFTGK